MIFYGSSRELIRRKVSKSKHIKIMDFLTYYVNFENREMMIKFEEDVEQLTGRTTPMGVKEILLDRAKNQGREEGAQIERNKALREKKAMALRLKAQQISAEIIADATDLTIEEIQAL